MSGLSKQHQLDTVLGQTGTEPGPEERIKAVFARNAILLSSELDNAGVGVKVYRQIVNGKKCVATPLNLYVEHVTGRILDITSQERDLRRAFSDNGRYITSPLSPRLVTPAVSTAEEIRTFGDISKIPVWYQTAWPMLGKDIQHPPNKLFVDRPDTWNRNSQIVLFDVTEGSDITKLMPDALGRGVLLKSLEIYNQVEEPAVVDNV